jgi:hypothetical protein
VGFRYSPFSETEEESCPTTEGPGLVIPVLHLCLKRIVRWCCLAPPGKGLAHPSWEGLPAPVDAAQRLPRRGVHLHSVPLGRTLGVGSHLTPKLGVAHVAISQPLDLLEVTHSLHLLLLGSHVCVVGSMGCSKGAVCRAGGYFLSARWLYFYVVHLADIEMHIAFLEGLN